MAHNAYTFRYRVRNWRTYNQALISRGGITFWIDEAAIAAWRNSEARSGLGAPRIYSDIAIQCTVMVQSVYHLSLRAAQGFVSSLMSLMKLNLPVPTYSTVCRRQGTLRVPLSLLSGSRPRHIVIDATGLRVYGAGEWHVRKHRGGGQRIWRKLHLGVDEHTKEIVAVEITASYFHDSRMLPSLLTQIPGKVCQVSGDGAYDTKACYMNPLASAERKPRFPLGVMRNGLSVLTLPQSGPSGMPTFVRFSSKDGMLGALQVVVHDRAWQRMPCFGLRAFSVSG